MAPPDLSCPQQGTSPRQILKLHPFALYRQQGLAPWAWSHLRTPQPDQMQPLGSAEELRGRVTPGGSSVFTVGKGGSGPSDSHLHSQALCTQRGVSV